MINLFQQIHYSASTNVSPVELVILLFLAVLAWVSRKKLPWLPVAYSVFLIVHITLLRRAPGYDERAHLTFRFFLNAKLWADNVLNLFLYVPLGWTAHKNYRNHRARIILCGLLLSACCEAIQFFTTRGCADVNDILFNTLGTAVGVWLAGMM